MKQITPEQVKLLQSPLPPESIKPHPTKTFLSSIKAIYVVERLNAVFGIGSWQLRSTVIDNSTAMIVVKSVLTIPEYGIELESFGGNDNGGENSKNHDTGDAYKGATTDALTKICSYLEIGIDVFKGLKSAPVNGTTVNLPVKDLPELVVGTEEYDKTVAVLALDKMTMVDVKKKRTVSEITEKQLVRDSELLKKVNQKKPVTTN